MYNLTNNKSCLVLYHAFGEENDIHRSIRHVHNFEKPVLQYQKGASLHQQSLTMDDEYLQSNFVGENVIYFPPDDYHDHLKDTIADDDFVNLLIQRYKCSFSKKGNNQSLRHVVLRINKHKNQLLVNRYGLMFQGDDLIMTFDNGLNIITVTAFSSSTNEADIYSDLKQLEGTLKSFVQITADLLTDDLDQNKHVAIVGLLCLTSEEHLHKSCLLSHVNSTSVKDFLTRWEVKDQEHFDRWYKKVWTNENGKK